MDSKEQSSLAAADTARSPSPEASRYDPNLKGPPQACLFVASLSLSTTEDALHQFFSPYGEIVKIKILKDRSSRPYAFIQYKIVDEANNASLHTHNQILDGKRLRVEKARVNRTLFIAKIDKSMTNSEVRELCEQFGPVESVTIIKNHYTNQSKGCGFVKYQYREDAVEAFSNLKNVTKKSPWIVEWATSTNDPDIQGLDKRNLFIGGLSPRVTKESVEERFSVYGKLETLTLINKEIDRNEEGEESSRNAFCFLRYVSENSSISAIENENGTEWLDRRIRVQFCESPEMKMKRRQTKYYGQYFQSPYTMRGISTTGPFVMMGGTLYNDPYNTFNYYQSLGYGMLSYSNHWYPLSSEYIEANNFENQSASNIESPATEPVIQALSSMHLQDTSQGSTVSQY